MSAKPEKLVVKAPAKINLYLEVLGRRKNGYHDIRSVVVPVSLYDVVALEKTNAGIETVVRISKSVSQATMDLGKPEDNLTTRAAVLLKKATGYRGGARIHLEKNIPVGGGLGGGSSDAAAVLTGLNRLWKTDVSKEDLIKIGSRLGYDVPAMIFGGPVRIEGLGEKVVPIRTTDKNDWWLVIVNPCYSVSTKDIYSRYSQSLTSPKKNINSVISALRDGNLDIAVTGLFNSLQETVFKKYPLIEIVAESLEKTGAIGVLLSGSGASVFGLARDEAHAYSINQHVRKILEFPVWSKVVQALCPMV